MWVSFSRCTVLHKVFHCSSSSMATYDGGWLASVSWQSVKFNIGAPWSSTSVPNFLAIGSKLTEISNGSLWLHVPTYILRRRLRFSNGTLICFGSLREFSGRVSFLLNVVEVTKSTVHSLVLSHPRTEYSHVWGACKVRRVVIHRVGQLTTNSTLVVDGWANGNFPKMTSREHVQGVFGTVVLFTRQLHQQCDWRVW